MQPVPSSLLVFGRIAVIAALFALLPARGDASEAATWISQHCTAPGGALRVRPGGRYISGYFGTLVADALVRSNEETAVALAWMQWYAAHAHDSGTGIDGVPDDADLVDDREVSRGRPDSTDAYGAMFLALARDAYDSGDPALRQFVVRHYQLLVRIMDSSIATMQPNGLTWSRPGHPMFYTIDNAQVYRGLLDAADLFRRAFHNGRTAARYEALARRVKHGIDTVLWDPATQTFRPYMNDAGTSGPANLSVPYPDALAQVFATYYGVIDPRSKAAASLVQRAAPALLASGDHLDEQHLVLLVTQALMGHSVDLPPFSQPKLCIDAAWYLDASKAGSSSLGRGGLRPGGTP